MRVLLVQPDPPQSMGLQQMARLEPLGLEMIAGAVRDRHEVLLLDLRFAHDALLPTLFDFRPDLVGISSTFTVDAYQALRVARTVKANNPHTLDANAGLYRAYAIAGHRFVRGDNGQARYGKL